MTGRQIQEALADISREQDPAVKSLKLASVCSSVFRERGIDLVLVGGSAIEFFTEGAYTSGDVDLCVVSAKTPLNARLRQALMAQLGAVGGPRSWQVADAFIDILGPFENLALTAVRKVGVPYGEVWVSPPEELLVERVLVSVYPEPYAPAREAANKLAGAALSGELEIDWNEGKRLASLPAYGNWPAVKALINEEAKTLKNRSPYDPDE